MHPLIDVSSLAGALTETAAGAPVVLDVRWRLGGAQAGERGIESYLAGHIPGAVFLDLDRDLCGAPGAGGRHPLPDPARFQRVMRRAGVSPGRLAVVYDDADATAAARAWWTLRYFGHDEVQVLDGGYQAWVAAGRPVQRGRRPQQGSRGTFTARPGHLQAIDAAEAARLARYGLLLDARAPERYRGEAEPVDPVAGHIPGAVTAPTLDNVQPDGRFKGPAELWERFTALGADAESLAGVYCGSGVTAAHEVLALTLAGFPAALYVGSWSEWITDPARPVTVGPGRSKAEPAGGRPAVTS